jgi:hypothetical protein
MAEVSTSKSKYSKRAKKVFLIGSVKSGLTGSKLPSIGDVLKVLFYNLRYRMMTSSQSIILVSDEVLLFWRKARIPTQNVDKVRAKIRKLYEEWGKLQKK